MNGRALLVGLKSVDPTHYAGQARIRGVEGCEADVDAMTRILQPLGYDIQILKTRSATVDGVLRDLRDAVRKTREADIFVFYFSGHGDQVRDRDGDEADGYDEALACFDGQLVDDTLGDVWTQFIPGARIFMLSDSCHSGTVNRFGLAAPTRRPIQPLSDTAAGKMRAQLIHFGACRDAKDAVGRESGGEFTKALAGVWNNGAFTGDYPRFYERIVETILTAQEPQYQEYGPVGDAFRRSRPFSV